MKDKKIGENISATGQVNIKLFDSEGNIKDERNIHNLVVTVGKNVIASRLVGTSTDIMTHMAIGTGTTTPDVSDTVLETEAGRVTLASGTATDNAVTYTATFTAGTGTGAITEAGLFNASSSGDMLAHTTFPVVNKSSSDSIAITWVVTIK